MHVLLFAILSWVIVIVKAGVKIIISIILALIRNSNPNPSPSDAAEIIESSFFLRVFAMDMKLK